MTRVFGVAIGLVSGRSGDRDPGTWWSVAFGGLAPVSKWIWCLVGVVGGRSVALVVGGLVGWWLMGEPKHTWWLASQWVGGLSGSVASSKPVTRGWSTGVARWLKHPMVSQMVAGDKPN